MKRRYRTAGLAAAAFLLTAGVCAGPATAYFTTSVSAEGGHGLQLGFTTTMPDEDFANWTKDLKVRNTGDEDCYIRVTAFAGAQYPLKWTAGSDGKWTEGTDGYWYYREILNPGETAEGISVRIEGEKEEAFQVIVVQECAPVPFGKDGEVLGWESADWSGKADVVKGESGEDV